MHDVIEDTSAPGERLTEEDAPDTSGVLQPAATGERLQGDIQDVIANISQKVMADHGALRESDSPAPPEVLAAATTGERLHADSSGVVQPAASGERLRADLHDVSEDITASGERLAEEDAPDTSGVLQPAASGERLQADIQNAIPQTPADTSLQG